MLTLTIRLLSSSGTWGILQDIRSFPALLRRLNCISSPTSTTYRRITSHTCSPSKSHVMYNFLSARHLDFSRHSFRRLEVNLWKVIQKCQLLCELLFIPLKLVKAGWIPTFRRVMQYGMVLVMKKIKFWYWLICLPWSNGYQFFETDNDNGLKGEICIL